MQALYWNEALARLRQPYRENTQREYNIQKQRILTDDAMQRLVLAIRMYELMVPPEEKYGRELTASEKEARGMTERTYSNQIYIATALVFGYLRKLIELEAE